MKKRHLQSTLLLAGMLAGINAAAEFAKPPAPTMGGICFRMDDNQNPQKWSDVNAVFNRHSLKFGASLNIRVMNPAVFKTMKTMDKDGQEIMDHTPMHNITKFRFGPGKSAKDYEENPGVDHIAGNTVFLRFTLPSPKASDPARKVRLDKDKLTLAGNPDARTQKELRSAKIVYLPDRKKTYELHRARTPGEFTLRSLWGEKNVAESPRETDAYFLGDRALSMVPEALELLGRNALELYAAAGCRRPYTWIQPGGGVCNVDAALVRETLGKRLGYKSAATYIHQSKKVFNEYNPDGNCAYAMMWGDFDESRHPLDWNQTRIADLVALHHVAIGHSHMHPKDGWENYMKRLDGLLAWCVAENIPVKTQSQWADLLYSPEKRIIPSGNVFPALNIDRDHNGRPDGYQPARGRWDLKTPAIVAKSQGKIFSVENLGGLVKGRNTLAFSVQVEGSSCRLEVSVKFPDTNAPPLQKSFSLKPGGNSCEWLLTIPEKASTADFVWTLPDGGDCRISPISLTGLPPGA